MPYSEQLVVVQEAMSKGDGHARRIYATIGTELGYAVAHYSEFYDLVNVLLLGRVIGGEGGTVIIEHARQTLDEVFPELADQVSIRTLGEKDKRHGQAVAAASLPELGIVRLSNHQIAESANEHSFR